MNPEFAESGVSRSIAPEDDMFWGDDGHYFAVGAEAADILRRAVARAGISRVGTLLDLPCGYGRVLRWLRVGFPETRITACDSNAGAVAFCAKTFPGIRGVVARADDTHRSALDGPFDVIWCGSLLTHWNAPRWTKHLQFCADLLTPGGVLAFTTHGEESVRLLEKRQTDYGLPAASISQVLDQVAASGFGYVDYPGLEDYGISVALPRWVEARLESIPGLVLRERQPAGWDRHQDVWIACRRQ